MYKKIKKSQEILGNQDSVNPLNLAWIHKDSESCTPFLHVADPSLYTSPSQRPAWHYVTRIVSPQYIIYGVLSKPCAEGSFTLSFRRQDFKIQPNFNEISNFHLFWDKFQILALFKVYLLYFRRILYFYEISWNIEIILITANHLYGEFWSLI